MVWKDLEGFRMMSASQTQRLFGGCTCQTRFARLNQLDCFKRRTSQTRFARRAPGCFSGSLRFIMIGTNQTQAVFEAH